MINLTNISPSRLVAMTFFKILFQRLFFPKLSQITITRFAAYRPPFWRGDSFSVIVASDTTEKKHCTC